VRYARPITGTVVAPLAAWATAALNDPRLGVPVAAEHTVIRVNHLGDWGTQFGMLTQHMLDTGIEHRPDFAALGVLYREAKHRFDIEPAFKDAARMRVVALQSGDPATLALWHDLVDVSLKHINEIYRRLDVTLTEEHVTGDKGQSSARETPACKGPFCWPKTSDTRFCLRFLSPVVSGLTGRQRAAGHARKDSQGRFGTCAATG
jgi:tRNA synthetase class I (R)